MTRAYETMDEQTPRRIVFTQEAACPSRDIDERVATAYAGALEVRASNMSGGVRVGSAGHVFKTTRTALKNGTISHIRPATGAKMFRGALEEYQIPVGTAVGVAGAEAFSELGAWDCGCP